MTWHLHYQTGSLYGPGAIHGQLDVLLRADGSFVATRSFSPTHPGQQRAGTAHERLAHHILVELRQAGFPSVPIASTVPDGRADHVQLVHAGGVESLCVTDPMRIPGTQLSRAVDLLELLGRSALGEASDPGFIEHLTQPPLPAPPALVKVELPLAAPLPEVLASRVSPPQRSLAANAERALDDLSVVVAPRHQQEPLVLISDGLIIHRCTARGAIVKSWDARAEPELDIYFQELAWPREDPVLPRLQPAAVLGPWRSLWFMHSYRRDGKYLAVPVLLDMRASQALRPLAPLDPRNLLRGTEPRAILGTADPEALLIRGEVDGGAMADLDDYIPVETGYYADLRAGTYGWYDSLEGSRTYDPYIAAGLRGLWTEQKHDDFGDRATLKRVPGALALDLGAAGAARIPDVRPEVDAERVGRALVASYVHAGLLVALDLTRLDRLVAWAWRLEDLGPR